MTTPTATPDRPYRVLGIAGSLREASFNKALLRAAAELAPEALRIEIFDGLREIPPYDWDVDAVSAPPSVVALKDAIRGADALLIATAEYNYGIPGVLKNAIDWASRPPATTPLAGKPTALMGAAGGMSGTIRAQLSLRQTLVFTDTPVMPRPEVLVAFAAQKFDASLRLTDEATRTAVVALLERFVGWIGRFAVR